MPRTSAALVLFLALTIPARAQIVREHAVSEPVYGPAPGWKGSLNAAFDGENFFAVWEDYRAESSTLYAARVDGRGQLLDQPTGMRVPVRASNPFPIAVADGYVLIWNDGSINAALFNRNGDLISGPRRIVDDGRKGSYSIASNGSTVTVAFRDRAYTVDAKAELIERDIPLPAPGGIYQPMGGQMASNGTGFFVTWQGGADAPGIHGVALDARGHPTGSPVLIDPIRYVVAVASNGNDYLVLYLSSRGGSAVRHVSADGQTVGPEIVLPPFQANGSQLLWTGESYLVTSYIVTSADSGPAVLEGMRLRADGTPEQINEAMTLPIRTDRSVKIVAGRETLTAFTYGPEVMANAIDVHTLRSVGSSQLDRSSPAQEDPAIASNGRNYFAVWSEPPELRAGRINLEGEPLDGRGTCIPAFSDTQGNRSPRVLFDGQQYIVAWVASENGSTVVKAARVNADTGAFLDGPGGATIAEARSATSLDLGFDGQSYVVVWGEYRGHIMAARFNRFLQTLDVRSISPDDISAGEPSIAWNGEEWLVVFEEQSWNDFFIPAVEYHANVRATRLSTALTVLDPQPILVASSGVLGFDGEPQVASDGNDFLIAWTHRNVGSFVLARYFKGGELQGDAFAIADAGRVADVVWDGARYAIASVDAPRQQLGAARVTHAGPVSDPGVRDRITIATGIFQPYGHVLSLHRSRVGAVVAAYVRLGTESVYGGVDRVFTREVNTVRTRAVGRR